MGKDFAGGAWNKNGVIVFAGWPGLYRVSAEGGEPVALLAPDASKKEICFLFPQFLPDGQHFICMLRTGTSNSGVYLGSLDSKQQSLLLNDVQVAFYVEPGCLLFQRGRSLFSQPFDPQKLLLSGKVVSIADNLLVSGRGDAAFGASQAGPLIYRSGPTQAVSQFIWLDRDGAPIGYAGDPSTYLPGFDLSRDGKRIVVWKLDPSSLNQDIWLLDWARSAPQRLTFDKAVDDNCVWSHDGHRIAFTSQRRGKPEIFIKDVNGAEQEIPLVIETESSEWMEDWSEDDHYIAAVFGQGDIADLYAIPLFGDRKPFRVIHEPAAQDEPHFSFDGKWLAYDSNESGAWEVYTVSFPEGNKKRQISTHGGAQPRWRSDDKELYYLAPDGKMMAVEIGGKEKIEPGKSRVLFDTGLYVDPVSDQYAVTSDGRRFLILKPIMEAASAPITVVLNWTSLLKK
jgi:eukaryotic-like serine/threonine-protein kinase